MMQIFRSLAAGLSRRTRMVLIGAALGLVLIAAIYIKIQLFLARAPGSGSTSKVVSFERGTSLRTFANRLEKAGIISSARLFTLGARLQGADSRVQAGAYLFTDAMPPAEILRKMVAGEVYERKFAVPEGYSIYQLAELLDGKDIFPKEDFLRTCTDRRLLRDLNISARSVEGYLFPSTYNLVNITTPEALVRAMVAKFHTVYDARFSTMTAGSGLSRQQIITLASMVEKEAKMPGERPLIASVFLNRLRTGMPLQSDPTAVYGVRAFAGKVTKADIERNSAYNTYRIAGLPPGPIGNPSEGAIEAVLQPAHTGYYYFVARKDGSHQFSATLAEHNLAVNRYLKTTH